MVEMINYSVIQKSQLESMHRMDAEYYQPEYLDLEKKIYSTSSYKLWGNIEGRFITGPFGSEFEVENYTSETQYRYVRGKDVKEFFLRDDDNVYIPEKDYERLKKYSLKEGDILISVVGTLGNAAIADSSVIPAIFSCKSTVFRTESINPLYFIAYLNSLYGYKLLKRSVRGAVQTGLNIDDLRSLPVFIPSQRVQESIASSVLNAKQEHDKSKSLYSQAEVLLLEELGLKNFKLEEELSYIVNLSDIKLAHRTDAEYFQPKYERLIKNLGKDKQNLKLIAKRKTKKAEILAENDYKYIEISDVDVGSGEVTFNIVKGSNLPANAKMKIEGGELIVSKVRPTRGAVGIIPDDCDESFVASGAFSIFEVVSPTREYLQVILRSIVGELQLEKPTTGTSYPTVTDEDIEELIIPILSKSVQQKIADLVRQSQQAHKKAKELLEKAKREVENSIENNSRE
jgi:restriction endonuclease S subunit